MLGVLLFPYLDVGLQKEDWFRKRYESYRAYMGIRGNNIADLGRKQKSDEEFKKADRISGIEKRGRNGVL